MKRNMFLSLLVMTALLTISYSYVSAHGHIHVGDYELVIGFRIEPAFQGEPNGLDLFVTDTKSGERVNGLEETLKAAIVFGDARKELTLRPRFGQDGAYTADVLPTETGDYTWHIIGMINDTQIDVSMTSGPDTFSSVIPKSTIAFPSNEPSTVEILAVSRSVAETARIATIIAGAGVLLGFLSLLVSFLAFRSGRHRVID